MIIHSYLTIPLSSVPVSYLLITNVLRARKRKEPERKRYFRQCNDRKELLTFANLSLSDEEFALKIRNC